MVFVIATYCYVRLCLVIESLYQGYNMPIKPKNGIVSLYLYILSRMLTAHPAMHSVYFCLNIVLKVHIFSP